jgi:hypothetical protein
MKVWLTSGFLTLTVALGTAAHAQSCVYPAAPVPPPDGATATLEQMKAANKDYGRYNTEMNVYLDCLKAQIDAATPKDASKLTPEQKKAADEKLKYLDQKNNAAVDELQSNVQRFNEQLKIFKAKQKS